MSLNPHPHMKVNKETHKFIVKTLRTSDQNKPDMNRVEPDISLLGFEL